MQTGNPLAQEPAEEDRYRAYALELYGTPDIRVLGWADVMSPEFQQLTSSVEGFGAFLRGSRLWCGSHLPACWPGADRQPGDRHRYGVVGHHPERLASGEHPSGHASRGGAVSCSAASAGARGLDVRATDPYSRTVQRGLSRPRATVARRKLDNRTRLSPAARSPGGMSALSP